MSQPVIQTRKDTGHLVRFICASSEQKMLPQHHGIVLHTAAPAWMTAQCQMLPAQFRSILYRYVPGKINTIGPIITIYKPPTSARQKHKGIEFGKRWFQLHPCCCSSWSGGGIKQTTHHLGTKLAKANKHLSTCWEILSLRCSSREGPPIFQRVKYFGLRVFKAPLQREERGSFFPLSITYSFFL